ncbi:uncharacterized protein BO66DRAFT_457623 [Aspergillus aculeatinus CBS 121060]|uniref:Uncharacterized protein n=1 Tax=Aspergillus aculeatinus CBS 121060 TaxID=1448322 RepID=A0ACD1H248_9EURO|nr:hypothetical protein BO66DRAFT_457623 [Aspergillus aculeatinus CBS 121060]RAH67609.1 hypothetical protein BO66DRAFT_457623 [Aspergillus aculeatinus CBS 121060]
MNSKFAKSISSRLFTFIVGSEEKRITVHSDVLASLSSELDSLLNARLLEEGVSELDWSYVEADTFIRLCEYAYVGDYTPPPDIIRNSKPTGGQPQLRADAKPFLPRPSKDRRGIYSESWKPRLPSVYLDRSAAQSEKPSAAAHDLPRIFNPSSTRDAFNHLHTCLTARRGQVSEERKKAYAPRKIPLHLRKQLTPNLLGHAKLCVLAEQHDIVPLRDLVFEKLATTLREFELFEDHVDYLIELVRFSYLHTRPRDDEIFCLRDLLATYVFSRLKQLYESVKFLDFAREGGDFVVEVRQKKYNWRLRWGQLDRCPKRPDPFAFG